MFEFLKQFLAGDKPTIPKAGPQAAARESDPDEEILASIDTYRKQMFDIAETAMAANQRDAESDNHKIERAERFLKESGLGHGMARFLTTVWSTRSEAERATDDNPLPGKYGMQLTGGGCSEKRNEWIAFLYGKHRYKVENRPKDWSILDEDDDYRYGEGSLFCDGFEVLKIETRRHYSAEYFLWDYSRVLVFRKGDWIPEMVELFTQFEIEDREILPKLMMEAQRKQAGGIRD